MNGLTPEKKELQEQIWTRIDELVLDESNTSSSVSDDSFGLYQQHQRHQQIRDGVRRYLSASNISSSSLSAGPLSSQDDDYDYEHDYAATLPDPNDSPAYMSIHSGGGGGGGGCSAQSGGDGGAPWQYL